MATYSSATITSSLLSPSTKTIKCNKIIVGFNRDITVEPNANPGTLAYAQTQAHANPVYSLVGVHFLSSSTYFSYADLLTIAKLNYGPQAAATLAITFGKDNDSDNSPDTSQSLVGFDGSTTSIKVVLKDFNFTIDLSDSRDGYRPMATINFVETL